MLHPIFIMIVWVPCVLIGIWAAGADISLPPGASSNSVLSVVVAKMIQDPLVSGLLTAGILAAIMSSLDSQFMCLGTMFTHDIVLHAAGKDRFNDRQQVMLGRGFIVLIVLVTYLLSLLEPPNIFDLAVWCFSGFASLFPLVFAAIYWRRVTKEGAIASILAAAISWMVLFYDGLIAPAMNGVTDGEDYKVLGMMPVAVMFAASSLALVVVSLMTTPPPSDHVDRFIISKKGR